MEEWTPEKHREWEADRKRAESERGAQARTVAVSRDEAKRERKKRKAAFKRNVVRRKARSLTQEVHRLFWEDGPVHTDPSRAAGEHTASLNEIKLIDSFLKGAK